MTKLFPIKNYEGKYSITKDGKIYSYLTNKWMKTHINKDGYLLTSLRRKGNNNRYRVSRLVAETFISNPENKPEVNHNDGDKLNNNDWNLEWSTSRENTIHAEKNGLAKHPKTAKIQSKYIGITWHYNKWRVRKNINGIRHEVGRFKDEEDAYHAYINFRV